MLAPVYAHMRAAIAPLGDETDPLYGWLAYQMGWADSQGRPDDARTGKGIRPQVCLLACQAIGGDGTAAVPVAAAIEITHEFSLVHDDIEDGDRLRRGRPAIWTIIGQAQAINAGDALLAIARRELALSPLAADVRLDLARRYDEACVRLAEGQYLDISFETADRIGIDSYVAMVRRKTGALLAAAAAMGARAGGADSITSDAFGRYGEALGVAFQMQDDVLGMWGAERATGKPAGRDLERRKKSLPVVLAGEDATLGPELRQLYACETLDPGRASAMAVRLADAGVRAQSKAVANHWSAAAIAALDTVTDLADGARSELEALAKGAVERDR